ncbi:MAG: TlyA family RNA methyltransferase [Erysipelotrichaceae bacterium]|nr:TlyA family RNA methyltransferase [Erysipelotrichaceae bacterium]
MDRIDIVLVKNGYFDSRENAKKAITMGLVLDSNNKVITKPALKVEVNAKFTILGEVCPFVSRGGYKLEKAIQEFNLTLKDKVMLDIGASTGGFTDCALQNGVRKVYCIDVGHDQLHQKIKNNPFVINKEGTDFKKMDKSEIEDIIDFASMDVSFTSSTLLFPKLQELLKQDGIAVILIKPQFEAGKENISKNGIVKDKDVHIEVINKIIQSAIDNNFSILNLTYSPVKGDKSGNIEYLIELLNRKNNSKKINIEKIVNQAFNNLK